jgi:hypothetical protein
MRNRATFSSTWLFSIALVALIGAAPAQAAPGPAASTSEPGERAVAEWDAANPWSYGTDTIFGLSRGLEENGVTGGARIAVLFVTVPFDLVQLPAALIAGLWGD